MLSHVQQVSEDACATGWQQHQHSSPFGAVQQHQQRAAAVAAANSPDPGSATSAETAAPLARTGSQSSSPSGSTAETPYNSSAPVAPEHQQQGYASMMAGAATTTTTTTTTTATKRFSASRFIQDKEWLYRLITFPAYFTPCPSCCGGARMPKREQLMTQFDTEYPYRVYCSHCSECKERVNSGYLLQVRRSAFKDVVKATDILRFGADVAGVQQYTLNGSKVIYLNREQTPEKKGNNTNAAPAACSVDGRAMMDKSSSYCSLKCKLIAEDPGFTSWLDTQDPSVRILSQAAANAPPKPTPASKRAAQPTSSSSSGGSSECTPMSADGGSSGNTSCSSRPLKCARTLASSAMADSAAAAAGGNAAAVCQPLQRAATATGGPMMPPAPAGLKRIRINLPSKQRQQSAPTGLLQEAAAAGSAAMVAASSWMELDNALSCSAAWDSWDLDSSLDSPCCFTAGAPHHQQQQERSSFAAVSDVFENDGSMSPALINAPTAFNSGSCDDWWLCGSPLDGAFTGAGMGALLNAPDALGPSQAEQMKQASGCGFGGSLSGAVLLAPVGSSAAGSPHSQGAETMTAGLACW